MRALQSAEKLSFVSGYRFSDTASRLKSDAPLGAEERKSSFHRIDFALQKNAGHGFQQHEQNEGGNSKLDQVGHKAMEDLI
jgi:hypothetical protein